MAALFISSGFLPLSSHKHWNWHCLQHPPRKHFSFTICASSSSNKSSRSSRKVKSNQELYNDIREFLSAVGLPMSHVPSMKELSHHGRNDLANIVRRRGYKFVRQLLESSIDTDVDGFVAEKSLAGQDQKVTNEVADVSLSIDVSSEAASSTLDSQNESEKNVVEEIYLSTNISPMKDPSSGSCTSSDVNSDGYNLPPTEYSSNSPSVEKVSPNVTGHHDKAADVTENISSLADVTVMENRYPSLNFDKHGSMCLESSDTETVEEKVAKFIQNGDMDMIEEDSMEFKSRTRGAEHLEQIFNDKIERAVTLKGNALTSKQMDSSATVNHPLCDDHLGTGLGGADFDSLEVEARRRDNQVEINHLKFVLHQKEMELSRLKEQIEKEKIALSVLQTKAETEINKAQKLISNKDEELLAAEESLSGLEEVEIQYSGDGEIVEVAGSFNGWHHRIKMDPLPSSSIIEPIGSRKSSVWSTLLWLYPGTYEIKFIVDGQWKVDPQRESVTKGGICNNILQVNR